jgi:hypothetical protein
MNIDYTHVARVYSGRSGCMCGCKGTYRDSDRSKKVMLTKVLKGDYQVEFFNKPDSDGTAGCIFTDNGDRTQVVYFKVGVPLFA